MDVDETCWSDRINRDQKDSHDQTYAGKKKKCIAKVKEKEKLCFYFFLAAWPMGSLFPNQGQSGSAVKAQGLNNQINPGYS